MVVDLSDVQVEITVDQDGPETTETPQAGTGLRGR